MLEIGKNLAELVKQIGLREAALVMLGIYLALEMDPVDLEVFKEFFYADWKGHPDMASVLEILCTRS